MSPLSDHDLCARSKLCWDTLVAMDATAAGISGTITTQTVLVKRTSILYQTVLLSLCETALTLMTVKMQDLS